jgi:flavin reductase (DIM6/NTAB) family NADH-FMN oxidoreductase RutF
VTDPIEPMTTAPFDGARFRQVLGHFPTGVTVITTIHEGKPVGLAVGSFASVSLEPPLVLFCAAATSSTWPKIRETGRFCVNILDESQEDVCRTFASKATDKFESIGWKHSPLGSPVLNDVLGWIDCEIADVVQEGDHDVVVGRVSGLDVAHEGSPLVFYRGGYGRFTS